MAQLERSSRSHQYSRSPQAQASPKFEQHLQENASSGWTSKSSSPIYDRSYDHNKKSVFMKVKEKAKQLKKSLSGKKKHGMGIHDDEHTSPSHNVKFEDAHEDAEYFGAPMYDSESALAPESIKQNSRQHLRAEPVASGSTKQNSGKHMHAQPVAPENLALDQVVPGNLALPNNMHTEVKPQMEKGTTPGKTLTGSVSDATHTIDSKFATGLTITNSKSRDTNVAESAAAGSGNVEGPKSLERSHEIREHSSNSPQKYDKGVSVKEYFRHKAEPGEDDTISDSLSPKKSPRQRGVVDKFRDAVASFIWAEQESEPTIKNDYESLKNPAYNPENPSPNIPVPSSISEEIEEKPHGRILQSN